MLDKNEVIKKMKERGFTVYAHMGNTAVHFISEHMYQDPIKYQKEPIINVLVYLDKEEFEGKYVTTNSINLLVTPLCGAFFNDNHFDGIIGKLETQAKWLKRLTD